MNSAGTTSAKLGPSLSIYKVSRLGRKLQINNDYKMLSALPKDVSERIWAETLQKEDNDLVVFEIREEIFDEAMKICYQDYMDRQTVFFTTHCAAQAWIKLLDWCFYRHDPGEDPSAYPPCYIPKRLESWEPDKLPDPSPKDTLCKQNLVEVDESPEETMQRWPSNQSLDMPVVPPIPAQCRFPGRVRLGQVVIEAPSPPSEEPISDESYTPLEQVGADSEMLQKVTDYGTEASSKGSYGMVQPGMTIESSLHGAGDSYHMQTKRSLQKKASKMDRKLFGRASMFRSRGSLPAIHRDSHSAISIISDCRIRNLRLETQFEITSEKMETPPTEPTAKRK